MNKITLKGLFSFLFLSASVSAVAQIQSSNSSLNSNLQINGGPFELTEATKQSIEVTGYAKCLTDENELLLQQKYPNRANDAQFEEWLAPKLSQIQADRASGRSQQVVYNIPVIIHVVHDGDALGTGENITDAQALSQIQVMNEDYRRLAGTPGGVNSTGAAVDVEINFCIAQQDESGNPTTGVVRHVITPYSNNQTPSNTGDWEIRSDVETMKTNTQWDPTMYLNMWTIRPGGNALDDNVNPGLGGLLGYAQFPSNSGLIGLSASGGAANTDGVVAAFDSMGTLAEDDGTFMLNPTYNLGRTMTHEVGHWLGLRHIWGDNSNCVGGSTAGDFCADTPDSNQPNYSCVTVDNCVSDGLGNDQVQNYMDYTPDACMDTFTQNQKDRIVAVMQSSPRRMELNASNVCNPSQPTISFTTTAPTSTLEGSDCDFVDYNFDLNISEGGDATATATLVATGTAVEGEDFELVNNSVVFATGATTATGSNVITLRVHNDSFVEADETVILNLNVTTTGSTLASAATHQLTILNDDAAAALTTTVNVYTNNFDDGTGLGVYDRDGDGNAWYAGVGGLDGFGDIVGDTALSESNGTLLGTGTGGYTPDQYLVSAAFTIPASATDVAVSYVVGSYNTSGVYQEHYSVYYTTISAPTAYADLEEFVLENDRIVPATGTEIRTHDLTPYAGTTGQIVIRHHNTPGDGLLLFDTLSVDATTGTSIQTVENSATLDQLSLSTSGTVTSSDAVSSDLMLDITNNGIEDFGCLDVFVSRAGNSAQSYNGNTTPNFFADKTFTITPTNVLTSTDAVIEFYFTSAEIAGWEAATGQTTSSLSIIREHGTEVEVVPAAVTAFGSEFIVSGTFTTGIDGTFYFGVPQASLSTEEFAFDQFSVYPNPTSGAITLSISTSEDVTLTVYDIRGRQILNDKYTNTGSLFNKTVNLNAKATGIYILKVEAGNKSVFKKIIVK